jgi:hypothetical protein
VVPRRHARLPVPPPGGVLRARPGGQLRRQRRRLRQGLPQLLPAALLAGAEREIAAAPEAEREALRKQKHIDLEERTNKGIQLCMKQCRTAATKEQVACLIAATTPEAAKKCLPE